MQSLDFLNLPSQQNCLDSRIFFFPIPETFFSDFARLFFPFSLAGKCVKFPGFADQVGSTVPTAIIQVTLQQSL